jgi:DNA-binding MarR family transcriptional regulator
MTAARARDRRLLFILQRASRAALQHANDRLLGHADISVAQLAALSYLSANPGCAITELADLLDLNKSAASGMVTRLERGGLVNRQPNPSDGRGTVLRVTAKGQRVREKVKPLFRDLMGEIRAGFSDDEMEIVLRFFNAMVERFGSEVS